MEFFTTEELAERWRVKPTTLGVWRKIGKGPKSVLQIMPQAGACLPSPRELQLC